VIEPWMDDRPSAALRLPVTPRRIGEPGANPDGAYCRRRMWMLCTNPIRIADESRCDPP
jgi:hypothetical protein